MKDVKDVILATSMGYNYRQLSPFLRSLQETGYDGDLVLYLAETDDETICRLRNEGVIVRRFVYPFRNCNKLRNPLFRLWPLVRPLTQALRTPNAIHTIGIAFQNLSIMRNFLYRGFLQMSPVRYRNVFLTDLRDVYFQRNPFERMEGRELKAFVEETWLTQGTDVNSSRWLRDLYGEEMVQRLGPEYLICSGTILGDYESICDYLDAFLMSLPDARSVMRMGLDQGIHNYLIYTGKLAGVNVKLYPNRTSEVLTMGLIKPTEELPRNENGEFVDANGVPYAVIHQFDRHEELAREIRGRYEN
jgi:hypothetical protein